MKKVQKCSSGYYPHMIKPLSPFWPIQKSKPTQIDACDVALGKRDLMQKQEWKKPKNWLVGDEKGAKMLQSAYPHMISRLSPFWHIPKSKPTQIDACDVALGKRDLMQK